MAARVVYFWSRSCEPSTQVYQMIHKYQMAIATVSVDDPAVRQQLLQSKLIHIVPALVILYDDGRQQCVEGVTSVHEWIRNLVARLYESEASSHRKGEYPHGGTHQQQQQPQNEFLPSEAQEANSQLGFVMCNKEKTENNHEDVLLPPPDDDRAGFPSAPTESVPPTAPKGTGVKELAQRLAQQGAQNVAFE